MFVEPEGVVLEKGTTPARRAISFSPSCQCMASAARQGMPSSVARGVQISGLSLVEVVSESMSRRNSKERARDGGIRDWTFLEPWTGTNRYR